MTESDIAQSRKTGANPELIKNLKLEFSPARIGVSVLLLLLFAWIGWNTGAAQLSNPRQMQSEMLFTWICGFGFLFTIVWGTYLVANSLLDEIKLKSWDFLRMSSLSPFKILTGKLFGAASVIWLVSLLGVLPVLIYAGASMMPDANLVRPAWETLGMIVLALCAWAILSHSLAFLLGLSTGRGSGRSNAFGLTALMFLMGFPIGSIITDSFNRFHQPNAPSPDTVRWYGFQIYNLDVLGLLLAFFAAWAFIGAWRALRKSLQYRDAPWAWLTFLTSGLLVLSGFEFQWGENFSEIDQVFHWALSVGIVTMAATCATEAGDSVRYRALAARLAARQYGAAFRDAPLWMLSFAVFLLAAIFNALFAIGSPPVLLFLVSLTAFAVRDLLVFHAVHMAKNIRRPLVGITLYCAVAYVLLPMLLRTLSQDDGSILFPLFHPGDQFAGYWLLLAAQLVAAGFLVRNQIKRLQRRS